MTAPPTDEALEAELRDRLARLDVGTPWSTGLILAVGDTVELRCAPGGSSLASAVRVPTVGGPR